MKKTPSTRKLVLDIHTLRQLDANELGMVAGGGMTAILRSDNVQCVMESVMASCANC
jgi:hypothetical protein